MVNPPEFKGFIKNFVDNLTKKYPKEIDFILLFGSAARGEFEAGISDVDLIIQIKNKKDKKKIEKYAEKIFWKYDKKHKTGFEKVCSSPALLQSSSKPKSKGLQLKSKNFNGPLNEVQLVVLTPKQETLRLFSSVENQIKLYKPFEVIVKGEIDWKSGEIRELGLKGWAVIAPVQQFAKKIKSEGIILYGKDILEEIEVKNTLFDKIKGAFVPQIISKFSFFVSIFFPNKGLKYAIKAVLYSIDDQLFMIEKEYKNKSSLNMKLLRYELGEGYSIRLFKKKIRMREGTFIFMPKNAPHSLKANENLAMLLCLTR